VERCLVVGWVRRARACLYRPCSREGRTPLAPPLCKRRRVGRLADRRGGHRACRWPVAALCSHSSSQPPRRAAPHGCFDAPHPRPRGRLPHPRPCRQPPRGSHGWRLHRPHRRPFATSHHRDGRLPCQPEPPPPPTPPSGSSVDWRGRRSHVGWPQSSRRPSPVCRALRARAGRAASPGCTSPTPP
jgi:hypothetical protein